MHLLGTSVRLLVELILEGLRRPTTQSWIMVRFFYSVKIILPHMSGPGELLMLIPPAYPLSAIFSVLLGVRMCKMMVHWPF